MTLNIELQRRAARLVNREVHCCMSSLVATLAGASALLNFDETGAGDLCDQAMELASPVLDYESAAREAGWEHDEIGEVWRNPNDNRRLEVAGGTQYLAVDAEDACQHLGVEPHELEVYEHWAISSWLADKLEAKGERVDRDFAGLIVWARTTTGQSISIDGVIESITLETGYVDAV